MGKSVLHSETRTAHGMSVRAEYYDDGTYSTWANSEPTVEFSLWKIVNGVFWFKHPQSDWETVSPNNKYYQDSLATCEALIAMEYLEKVISND